MKKNDVSTNQIFNFLKKHKMWYSVVCREDGDGNHLEATCNCPFCGDTEKKFSINTKTGMWNCFHLNSCGRKGDFYKLALLMGDEEYKKLSSRITGVKIMKKNYKEPMNKLNKIPKKELSEELYSFFEKRYIPRKIIDSCGDAIQEFGEGVNKNICFVHKLTEKENSKIAYIQGRLINEANPGDKTKKIISLTDNSVLTLWLKEKVNKKLKKLFITEGHFDVLALETYGFGNAVSVPQGVNSIDWVKNDWEFINSFHDVYLIFDNDPIGREKAREVADRLVTNTHIVELPLKDANDCLIAYKTTKDTNSKESKAVSKEAIWKTIINSEVIRVDEITTPDDHREELLKLIFNPDKTTGRSTGLKNVDSLINGIRDGELTLISGRSGAGKSTFLSQIILNFINAKTPSKVCLSSFEMKSSEILYNMIQQQFKEEVYLDGDKEKATNEVDLTLDLVRGYLSFINIKDTIEIGVLLKLMELAYRRNDVKYFVVDSLMLIENSDASENRGQTNIIRRLKNFTRRFEAHVFLVAHPRKNDGISVLRKDDILGTSNTTNLADNLLILHEISKEYKQYAINENLKRKKSNMSEIIVPNCTNFIYCDKFRFKGNKNLRAYFNFDEKSRMFIPCDINGRELIEEE